MDYRKCYDEKWLKSVDLDEKDFVVTITRAEAGKLNDQKGQVTRKPIVWFKGWPKPLALNKTNGGLIAGIYGNDMANWIGKRITIYPTTTTMGGKIVDCVRVRPSAPKQSGQPAPARSEPVEADSPAPPVGDDRCDGGTCGACSWCRAAQASEVS